MASFSDNAWDQGPLIQLPARQAAAPNPNQQPAIPGRAPLGPITQFEQRLAEHGAMKGIEKGASAGYDAAKAAWGKSSLNPANASDDIDVGGGWSPASGSAPLAAPEAASAAATDAAMAGATDAVVAGGTDAALAEAGATAMELAPLVLLNEGTSNVPDTSAMGGNPMMMQMATAAPWLAAGYLGGKAMREYNRGTGSVDFKNPANPFGFAKGGFVNPFLQKRQQPLSPNQQPSDFHGGFSGMLTHSKAPLSVSGKGLPNLHARMVRPGGEE